jgi:hypothetical protein
MARKISPPQVFFWISFNFPEIVVNIVSFILRDALGRAKLNQEK